MRAILGRADADRRPSTLSVLLTLVYGRLVNNLVVLLLSQPLNPIIAEKLVVLGSKKPDYFFR